MSSRLATPYAGLVPYAEDQAAFFFGRDTDRDIIISNLLASRLTILYGPSGVGKSSVLRAGVAWHLKQLAQQNLEESGRPELAVVVFGSWRDDPVRALIERAHQSVRQTWHDRCDVPADRSGRLDRALSGFVEGLGGSLLLVLDQFEDYFLYHPTEDGEGSFVYEFARAVNDPALRVNVLIGIREDAVAKLNRFKGRIPSLFTNYLRIGHLDRDAARSAIIKPIEPFNRLGSPDDLVFEAPEPALVEAVLDQVRAGQVTLGQVGKGLVEAGSSVEARIETPYLQLVLTRLWSEEVRAGSRIMRLQTLERLGGAEPIVRTHLDETMARLSPREQDVAAQVFHHLVTPSGAKIAHAVSDLAAYAELKPELLVPVLERLSSGEVRILRPVAPPPSLKAEPRYEIFHDVLAGAVLDWRSRWEHAREQRLAGERLAAERKKTAWLAGALALSGVVVLIMAALVVYANRNADRAKIATADSEHQRELGRAHQLALDAMTHGPERIDLALLLGLEANRKGDVQGARSSLLFAIAKNPNILRFMHGHPSGIRSVAFAPNDTVVASVSADGTINLWAAETGDLVSTSTQEQSCEAMDAAIAFDSKTLAVACGDGTIALWDLETSKRRGRTLGTPGAMIYDVDFAPDRNVLAAADADGRVTLWNIETGQARTLDGHTGKVFAVAFSPDGKTIASGGADGMVIVRDARSGFIRSRRTGHRDEVFCLSFSSDSKSLVSGGSSGQMMLWNISRASRPGISLTGHIYGITSLAFSPKDPTVFASASADKTLVLWHIDGSTARPSILNDGYAVNVTTVGFRRTGEEVVSGFGDGTVARWRVDQGAAVASAANGGLRAGPFGQVLDWEPHLNDLATADNDPLVAAGTDDGLVVYDAAQPASTKLGDDEQISAVAFSREHQIASAACAAQKNRRCLGARIQLWNAATNEATGEPLLGHDDWVTALAFSPMDHLLASGGADGMIVVWDLTSRQAKRTIAKADGMDGGVTTMAFSPNGETLAIGGEKTILLWTIGSDEKPAKFDIENGAASLAFSPNGRFFAIAPFRGSDISVWALANQTERRLSKHRSGVVGLAFSPDSSTLASVSRDGEIMLWEAETARSIGIPLLISDRAGGGRFHLAFGPDGKTLISGSNPGPLTLWNVESEFLTAKACDIARRNLTEAEWVEHLHDEPWRGSCASGFIDEAHAHAIAGRKKEAEQIFRRAVGAAASEGSTINNETCWLGSLDGFPSVVMPACKRAVTLAPPSDRNMIRDSEAVALAMLGDYQSALERFKDFIEWAKDKEDLQGQTALRQSWIATLEQGRSPFDAATIRRLRLE